MEVKSASSPAVYQCGVNTPANQLNGFDVDFEFENFVTNDPEKPPADWTDIDRVLLLIQNASQVAANHYALSSITLKASEPEAPVACVPPELRPMRRPGSGNRAGSRASVIAAGGVPGQGADEGEGDPTTRAGGSPHSSATSTTRATRP